MTHRFVWLVACSLVVAPGLVVSLTWPTETVLALFPACAVLIGIATVHYNLLTIDTTAPAPLRLVTANVASCAFAGAVVIFALVGLSSLIGGWVLLVWLVLAGSSPAAVRFYRRRFNAAGVRAPHSLSADEHPLAAHPPGAPERGARDLTDTELCQAWQASGHALLAATSPDLQVRIVDTRQAYLDELARRHAAGLHAWMSSGAGALDDVRPVLSADTGQGEGGIDWDALVFGQEDT